MQNCRTSCLVLPLYGMPWPYGAPPRPWRHLCATSCSSTRARGNQVLQAALNRCQNEATCKGRKYRNEDGDSLMLRQSKKEITSTSERFKTSPKSHGHGKKKRKLSFPNVDVVPHAACGKKTVPPVTRQSLIAHCRCLEHLIGSPQVGRS